MAIQDRITNKKISIIEKIESRIVYGLADRVAKMHGITLRIGNRRLIYSPSSIIFNYKNMFLSN